MNDEKDILQLKNRLKDLADKSYQQGIFTFSSFLGLSEQDAYHSIERELHYACPVLYGGHDNADRIMIRFGDAIEFGYENDYPISCIHIVPLMAKFAEKLSHRDFLGALMNLGIERSTLGDILVNEKEAWVFCQENMAQFICENLDKVRHNNVRCILNDGTQAVHVEEKRFMTVQVASLRADGVLAKVCHLSREASLNLFRAQRVYINGRLCENNSRELKPGDVVNARGFGKFSILDDIKMTKKGKQSVTVAY